MHAQRLLLALLSLSLITGCEKKKKAAAAPQPAATALEPTAVKRLGYAAYLPADTAALVSTTQLRTHLESWAGSQSYAQLLRYLADKTPAETAEPASSAAADEPAPLQLARSLLTTDTLLALGSGSDAALHSSLQLASLYAQLQAQSYALQHYTGRSTSPLLLLSEDKALQATALEALHQWQMPPLTMALNVSHAAEWLGQLFPEALRSHWRASARMGQVSGTHPFHFVEGSLETLLPRGTLQQWQQALPPGASAELAQQMLDILSTKPLSIGYGVVAGRAVLFIGAQRPSFDLAPSAEKSILQAEPCQLALRGGDSLLLHGYATAATRRTWAEAGLLSHLLQGWLAGISAPASGKDGQADATGPALLALAQAWHTPEQASTAVGMTLQWKESPVLTTTEALPQMASTTERGLKFSHVIHAEHTVASWVGRGSPLFRPLLSLLVSSAAAKAEPAAHAWAAETLAQLPPAALGTEHALLLDQPPQEGAWPRAAALCSLQSRTQLTTGWQPAALQQSLPSHFPLLQLTTPERWERYATTFYSYALPAGMNASPSLGVGEQHLILSTERELAESLARSILTAQRAEPSITQSWRIHIPRLQQLLPQLWPESAKLLAHPALSFVKELRCSTEQKAGQLSSQWQVELRSPQRFD